MFGLDDIMKKVDLGDILDKVGLSSDQKKEVNNQAVDALKYRANKEVAKGNKSSVENLLSPNKNSEDADVVAKKLEKDLEYNLKNKSNLEPGIIDQIKASVMSKFVGGAQETAKEKGDKDGKGLMGMFEDNDMVKGLQSKIKGFF